MLKNIADKMSDAYGVPKETVLPLAKLALAENREIRIENYVSVLEFSDEILKIKTRYSVIKILGINITINYINKYDLLVQGVFSEIKFEH